MFVHVCEYDEWMRIYFKSRFFHVHFCRSFSILLLGVYLALCSLDDSHSISSESKFFISSSNDLNIRIHCSEIVLTHIRQMKKFFDVIYTHTHTHTESDGSPTHIWKLWNTWRKMLWFQMKSYCHKVIVKSHWSDFSDRNCARQTHHEVNVNLQKKKQRERPPQDNDDMNCRIEFSFECI